MAFPCFVKTYGDGNPLYFCLRQTFFFKSLFQHGHAFFHFLRHRIIRGLTSLSAGQFHVRGSVVCDRLRDILNFFRIIHIDVYFIFLSFSLIRTSLTETFLGEMPVISPISSYERSSSHSSTIALSSIPSLCILLCSRFICLDSSSVFSYRLIPGSSGRITGARFRFLSYVMHVFRLTLHIHVLTLLLP